MNITLKRRFATVICLFSLIINAFPVSAFAIDLSWLWASNNDVEFQPIASTQVNNNKETLSYLFLFKHITELDKKGKSHLLGKKAGLVSQSFGILKQKSSQCDNAIKFIDNKADKIKKDYERAMGAKNLANGITLQSPPRDLFLLQEERDNVLLQCRDSLRYEMGDIEFRKLNDYTNLMQSRITDRNNMTLRAIGEDPLPEPIPDPTPFPDLTPLPDPTPTPLPSPTPTPQPSSAPNVYAYSSIDYDDVTKTAYGYSSVQMDYAASLYYRPKVSASIEDDTGNVLTSGEFEGTGTSADVSLSVFDQSEACEDFLITTVFTLIFIYVRPSPQLYWYDPFFFSSYQQVPLYTDGFGIFNPYWFSSERRFPWEVIVFAVATRAIRPAFCTASDIDSVEFESMNSPLDPNPGNGNPNTNLGLRIFPEKITASDTIDRTKVRIRATIAPARQGIRVYFRTYDMDDPSSDTAPVDSNGNLGNDNRGVTGTSSAGQLNVLSALTDSNGVARVELTVTKQPGDNFSVAASKNRTYLNSTTPNGSDLRNGLQTIPISGIGATRATPANPAIRTQLLTVWRRLHIEKDSMGTVSDNKVSGSFSSAVSLPAGSSPTLTVSTSDPLEVNRFEDGRLVTDGQSYRVTGNSGNTVVNPPFLEPV